MCVACSRVKITFTFTFHRVRKDQVANAVTLMVIVSKCDTTLEMLVIIRLGQTVLLMVNKGSRLKGRLCINFVNGAIYNGCEM